MKNISYPRVGIGVLIVNKDNYVLVGKRKSLHAPYFSIPGGHLETGETLIDAAKREVKEETNLEIDSVELLGVSNNLDTYQLEGKHYVSLIFLAKEYSGELLNLEPDKCEGWFWCNPYKIPEPHFEPSRKGITGFLNLSTYIKEL
ncbi:ADP-ribose pyrophosphatase YjhB (NUDIX family) [Fontibacillus solani]|uniref:ADP-ribose pyrophosphatase YjhB (NUDIX family) n=1 Tax=Fontibacillus solani TaxID=1572857 RepID=A0A7W3SV77_9BACL|nr:NUDIX domain-containing protein [Fontibacillus solani]MBA9086865.1 ADP-ribose pyrophosphatase YjhB (NUDIX family) [Fontibacillus solani]